MKKIVLLAGLTLFHNKYGKRERERKTEFERKREREREEIKRKMEEEKKKSFVMQNNFDSEDDSKYDSKDDDTEDSSEDDDSEDDTEDSSEDSSEDDDSEDDTKDSLEDDDSEDSSEDDTEDDSKDYSEDSSEDYDTEDSSKDDTEDYSKYYSEDYSEDSSEDDDEKVKKIKICDLKYTQDSILGKFRNGDRVKNLQFELEQGDVDPDDLEIDCIKKDGKYYCLANRRLYAVKQAFGDYSKKKITVLIKPYYECIDEFERKFTTDDDGESIYVRGHY